MDMTSLNPMILPTRSSERDFPHLQRNPIENRPPAPPMPMAGPMPGGSPGGMPSAAGMPMQTGIGQMMMSPPVQVPGMGGGMGGQPPSTAGDMISRMQAMNGQRGRPMM